MAIAATALLVVLGSSGRFYGDEWMYLGSRSLDPATWFAAHNEHWVTLHVIAYSSLVAIFGTSTYLPFIVALAVVHVLTAAGVWRLVASVAGEAIGLAAAAVFLVLGAGWQNLLWAFQMGMIGALGLGLWALVVLPKRPVLAAILMTAAVATQGDGLFIACAGVALAVLVRPRAAPLMLAPFVAFGAWVVLFGSTIHTRGEGLSLAVILGIPSYVATGIASAAAGLVNGPMILGLVLLFVVIYRVGLTRLGGQRPPPLVIAAAVGLLAQFTALALTRVGEGGPGDSRFIYLAAPWLLIIVGWVVSTLHVPTTRLALVSALVVAVNVIALVGWAQAWPTYIADDPRMIEYLNAH